MLVGGIDEERIASLGWGGGRGCLRRERLRHPLHLKHALSAAQLLQTHPTQPNRTHPPIPSIRGSHQARTRQQGGLSGSALKLVGAVEKTPAVGTRGG